MYEDASNAVALRVIPLVGYAASFVRHRSETTGLGTTASELRKKHMAFSVISNSFKDGDYLRSDLVLWPISALAALAATSRHT